MGSQLEQRIATQLEGRLRDSQPVTSLSQAKDNASSDFFTSDYLSLSYSNELRARFLERLTDADYILGARGSLVIGGNTTDHALLEKRLSDFYEKPALLFNSGFEANCALFSTLPQPGDVVVYDALVHSSVHEGLKASRVANSCYPFEHNSVASLKNVLEGLVSKLPQIANGSATVFVSVESIYTMEGDAAPLAEIIETVHKCLPEGVGQIFVDEAHSTGIYGAKGRGMVSLLGLEDKVSMRLHTFGKALAAHGAVVLAPPMVRSYLINYARHFIFSTAMHRAVVSSIQASLDMFENGVAEERIGRLFRIMQYTHARLSEVLAPVNPSVLRLAPAAATSPILTPVIPLISPHTLSLASYLGDRGYAAFPVLPPAVALGQERIRMCLHADNTREDVDRFLGHVMTWVASVEQAEKLGGTDGRPIVPKLEHPAQFSHM